MQTWKSSWIYVHGNMHSYADIYIPRSTSDITKWMQNFLLDLIKNGDAYRNIHTFLLESLLTLTRERILSNVNTNKQHHLKTRHFSRCNKKCLYKEKIEEKGGREITTSLKLSRICLFSFHLNSVDFFQGSAEAPI